jgi:molecular chaperone DnaK (HSP70)
MKPLGIGIDFGTTNSLAAAWGKDVMRLQAAQATAVQPIAFWHQDQTYGNRPHPSIVWYKPDDSIVVGMEARKKMQSLSDTTGNCFVRSVKRCFNSSSEWMHNGRRLMPYEVAAEIFGHLKRGGEAHPVLTGHRFEKCVVTVPVGFDGRQRREIRRAMERAGLRLQGFVHEPFAAMVAHFYHPERKLSSLRGKRVLVFDWGGGTLDICLVEGSQDGSTLYELAHDGIADRAGDDFDRRIMSDLRNRFLMKHMKLTMDDLSTRCRAEDRFWMNTEQAKIELTSEDKVRVRVPGFLDGNPPLDLSEMLKREEFDALIEQEVQAAAACTLRCLNLARISPACVDHVLMVGGTSLIPKVRRRLEEIFGARVHVTQEPDAAIARGAAIVAAEDWKPVNAITLGCELSRGNFFTLLPRGESLEAAASKKFVFYCTDPRDGNANFVFCRKPIDGDQATVPIGSILQVPVASERPTEFQELDRLVARITVTEDATLSVEVQHTGKGLTVSHEISDISFGLKLNS